MSYLRLLVRKNWLICWVNLDLIALENQSRRQITNKKVTSSLSLKKTPTKIKNVWKQIKSQMTNNIKTWVKSSHIDLTERKASLLISRRWSTKARRDFQTNKWETSQTIRMRVAALKIFWLVQNQRLQQLLLKLRVSQSQGTVWIQVELAPFNSIVLQSWSLRERNSGHIF